eukprot:g2525.t1
MSSSNTDPQDVIKILCSVASEQDIGGSLTRVIQKSLGHENAANSVKQLVSDLVHLGSVHDNDWELIIQSVKSRLSATDSDSQIFALNLIPSIPVRYLVELMIKDGLGDFIVSCQQDANPTVRSSCIAAFGHLLTQPAIIQAYADQPNQIGSCMEHWQSICNALVDQDNQVSGSAFKALKLMMERHNIFRNESISPSTVLISQWHDHCIHSLEQHLSAVIYQAEKLDPDGKVEAIRVLSLLVCVQLSSTESTSEKSPVLWTVPVIGQFLERQLASVDSAVVSRSAHALLEFSERVQSCIGRSLGVVCSISIPTLSLKAIQAMETLWESKESVPARAEITSIICKFLTQVDLSETGDIAVRMLIKISLIPNPSDRIPSLMRLWEAALAADLKLRRLRHSRGDVTVGASLQSIIESPFFTGIVAGHTKPQMDLSLNRSIQKASYPAYKQELVSTLMKVLMDHSRRYKIDEVFPAKAHEESKELTMELAIKTDVQTDVIDWFAASVVALYLTQACLGWDNSVTEGFYGLTLPSDLWIQQLQLTSQTLYTILDHFRINSFSQLRTLDEEMSKTRTGKILKTLAGEAFEIQKLMKRMVFFWSFLNDALKPRVFWIVCHHIELPDRVEDVWNHLKDSLKDLMITRPTEITRRQQKERMNAAKEGQLAPRHDTVYHLKTSTDPKNPAVAVDQSEVALEGITVGLLCFGILTETLMSQYSFISFACYYDRVRGIAQMLKEVCNQMLDEDFLTVDMFDQCQSILKQLDYIIAHKPEGYDLVQINPADEGATSAADSDQSITFLPVDLSAKLHEGYPFSNSKSMAYIITKRSRRYKALHKHLHLTKETLSMSTTGSCKTEMSPPVPSQPTSVDLATAVGGLDLKEEDSGWKILTGQGDPVQLSLRHEVDTFRRLLMLEIQAENKIGSDITGVGVSFAIEGSVSTYREGMLVWHPERLQANEPVCHEVHLGLIEFGSIEIQPFMELALQSTAEDFPALSCSSYSIPLLDLLIPVRIQMSPKVYFQELCSWPDSINTTAVCRWPGTHGGMQLLSALNKSKLYKIWPKTRNSLSFFQAVYLVETFTEAMVSLTITGQLVDLRQMGLAVWALPAGDEKSKGNVGYYLCKCTFASTSPRTIVEIRSKAAELLSDLSDGGLIPGLDPGVGRPPAAPPIHPEVYIDLPSSEDTPQFQTDLQSLAVQEWKRLNYYH